MINIKYIPNILTIFRIIITPFFILFFFDENFYIRLLSLILFFFGSVSDFLDGYLARKYNLVTDFGKFVDPLADKILILAAFCVLFIMYPLYVPLWMVILILLRDVLITFFRLYLKKNNSVLKTSVIAKRKTLFQIIVIHFLLIYHVFNEFTLFANSGLDYIIYFLMLLCVSFTLLSALHYFIINNNEL